jgi:single-stranded-DNA-specific exonuclease
MHYTNTLPQGRWNVYTHLMTLEMPNQKRWIVPPQITPEADSALEKFPPLLRQILFNRGYATDADARAYLNGKPNFDNDPFQMTGMHKAVERIRFAIQNNEPIAIYGDYDVDGVTATALLVETLRKTECRCARLHPQPF